jgi:predicted N-formylglutamate amidohydrolase
MTDLLLPSDPPVFRVDRSAGAAPFLLIADHAGRSIPQCLGTLGLSAADLDRHIAWDIGVAGLAEKLSAALDATLIMQNYSRLVIDCNRPPSAPDAIATLSEETVIPGNLAVSLAERQQREGEIFHPYHDTIVRSIDNRLRQNQRTLLISLHSFTPVYKGFVRPWHAGVLYHRDHRLAHALLARLAAEPGLVVGDNEPYSVSDETDYSIPVHGEQRGLLHVEIEIRQDLIAEASGQDIWVEKLARLLPLCLADIDRR